MSKQKRTVLGALLLVSTLVAATAITTSLDFRLNGETAARIKAELNEELSQIKAPAQSTLHHTTSSSKPRMAFVQEVYDTSLDYSPIRAHYDAELSSHGWKYLHEEHLNTRIKRCYSKGDYRADLSYEKGLLDQTFSIGMSWGMRLCD
jgi:hypothetical protein